MEFTCLQCRHRLTAEDDRAGERMACPNCSSMLTVPNPIGGKLTTRRLNVASEVPKPGRAAAVEVDEVSAVTLLDEPDFGFRFDVRLPKILGKVEREEIQQSADELIEKVERYLEQYPGTFRSGAFVLEVDRANIEPSKIDARVRLFGSLNHEPFNSSVTYYRERRSTSVGIHFGLLGVLLFALATRIGDGICWLFFRSQVARGRHRTIQKIALRQFQSDFDDAVDRPLGFFTGLWRKLNRPL